MYLTSKENLELHLPKQDQREQRQPSCICPLIKGKEEKHVQTA